jgi:hypothetical protein
MPADPGHRIAEKGTGRGEDRRHGRPARRIMVLDLAGALRSTLRFADSAGTSVQGIAPGLAGGRAGFRYRRTNES